MAYGQFNLCDECCVTGYVTCEPKQYGAGEYWLQYLRFGFSDPISSASVTANLQVIIRGDQQWTIYARHIYNNTYFVSQTYPTTGAASRTVRLIDPAAIPNWPWVVNDVTGDQAAFAATFGMTCQEFIDSLSLTVNPLAGDFANTQRAGSVSAPLAYASPSPPYDDDPNYADTLLRYYYPNSLPLGSYQLGLRTRRSWIGSPSCSLLMATVPETSPFPGTYWLGCPFEAGNWEFNCDWHHHVNYLPTSQLQVVCSGLAAAFTPNDTEAPLWTAWLSELSGAEIMCSCVYWVHNIPPGTNTATTSVKFTWGLHGRYASSEVWAKLELTYNWLTSQATGLTATIDVGHVGYCSNFGYNNVPAATRFTLATPGGWTMPVETAQKEYTLTDPNTGQPTIVTRNVLSDVDAFKSAASALVLGSTAPEAKGFSALTVSCS